MTIIDVPEKIAVAILVLAGGYGNGEERRKKLEEDGFDYREIQNLVNELYPYVKEEYEA